MWLATSDSVSGKIFFVSAAVDEEFLNSSSPPSSIEKEL